MRRVVLAAAAAATVGVTIWAMRTVPATLTAIPGNLPGGAIGSAINTRLNGPIYRRMAEALDLRPEDELLDVACGEGAFLEEYASRVHFVAGIDLYDVKVHLARRRLTDRIAAGTAEVVLGDAAVLPWEDGRFSVVSCMDAFEMFSDPGPVLSEICRVLRPGGRAVMLIGVRVPDATETHKVLGGTVWVWSEPELRRMMQAAGFGRVSTSYARFDSQLFNLFARVRLGSDEVRVVTAEKPGPATSAVGMAATEAFAIG
jgi:SAM-dependent methyltransferase